MKSKLRSLSLLLSVALLLSGCFAKSLYPFFTKEVVFFDEALIGEWEAKVEEDITSVAIGKTPGGEDGLPSYKITYSSTTLEGHLLKLEGQEYLNLSQPASALATEGIDAEYWLSVHGIYRLERGKDRVLFKHLGTEELKSYLKEHPQAVAYHTKADGEILLLSPQKELQEFIIKITKEHPEVWQNYALLTRAKLKAQ